MNTKKLLSSKPQKDGSETEYACGLRIIGSWAGRLEKHETFIKSQMGNYINNLESINTELLETLEMFVKKFGQSHSVPGNYPHYRDAVKAIAKYKGETK